MKFFIKDLYAIKSSLLLLRDTYKQADILMPLDRLVDIIDDAIDVRRPCKRIYVAGPLANGRRIDNVNAAIDAANELLDLGWKPFVPHLYTYWDDRHGHSYDEWLALDMEYLRVCNAVLRLPGRSKGADAEVTLANQLKIPVFLSIEHIREHSKEGFD